MPSSPPSLCINNCGTLVYRYLKCLACTSEASREREARRPNSADRGYDAKWRETRRKFLKAHPLCECDECIELDEDDRPDATDVDHIDGEGPNGEFGHDWNNLQALSHSHHSRKTVRQDGGFGRKKQI